MIILYTMWWQDTVLSLHTVLWVLFFWDFFENLPRTDLKIA